MEAAEIPSEQLQDPKEVLVAFVDYLRDTVVRKLHGMSAADLRTSRLPSGWSPLEMVRHLTFMERRWVEWGFAGEAVADPWGDDDPTKGRWQVPAGEETADGRAGLRAIGVRTRALVAEASVGTPALPGGRFAVGEPVPTLGWI